MHRPKQIAYIHEYAVDEDTLKSVSLSPSLKTPMDWLVLPLNFAALAKVSSVAREGDLPGKRKLGKYEKSQ